jgi:hypothetical protein
MIADILHLAYLLQLSISNARTYKLLGRFQVHQPQNVFRRNPAWKQTHRIEDGSR